MTVRKILRRLTCSHPAKAFIRNVYGDEINLLDCRSLWRCVKCGAVLRGRMLHKEASDG